MTDATREVAHAARRPLDRVRCPGRLACFDRLDATDAPARRFTGTATR